MKKIKKIISKSAVLYQQNKPLRILNIELPDYLERGQVLVRVHYSGICGSQIGEIDGVKGPDRFLPHLLGHEGVCSVLEVGNGVKNVKKGDRAIIHWRPGKGINSQTPIYKYRGKKINAGWATTFNEYAIVSENRLTRTSKNTNMLTEPLFGCAITTGFGVIENNAKLKKGESVLVYGAGGVGLNMIQLASIKKAYPIIAVDIFNNKLKLAKRCGATHVIKSPNIKYSKTKIIKVLGNQSLDVFIDNTGNTKVIELGYEVTSKNGRLVLVGVPKKTEKISINTLPLHFGKEISGSEGGNCFPTVDIPRYRRLLNQSKYNLNLLISKIYTLENINTAIKDMRIGKVPGRVVIKL